MPYGPLTPHLKSRTRISRAVLPFQRFISEEASGGIILLACTLIALLWANSSWRGGYETLWSTPLTIGLGAASISKPLILWINDGLMAVFFFVVGLEIKREVLVGELASARRAALPVAAALGGMLAPAAIFALFNAGGEGARGWGIPMATDIAFALGVLALLGSRAPLGLKMFLAALAIADDLGAVLVIAVFYSHGISIPALGAAAAVLAALAAANWLGVRRPLPYAIAGIALWAAVLASGIHATIAGVLLALVIPARALIDTDVYLAASRKLLDEFQAAGHSSKDEATNEGHHAALHALENAAEYVQAPLQRLEHMLHPWVTFAIMPVFALANAGVRLDGSVGQALLHPVGLGVALGLLIGKQAGIFGFAWLAVRFGFGALPAGVSWKQIYGAAWLGGIGFTMSLFVAGLAFPDSAHLREAKVGILFGSLAAGAVGYLLLSRLQRETPNPDAPG